MPCPRNLARGAAIAALLLATGLIVLAICVQRPNKSEPGHRIIVTEQRKSSAEGEDWVSGLDGGDLQDLRAKAFFLIATTTISPENGKNTGSKNSSGSLDMRQIPQMASSTAVRIEYGSYATIALLQRFLPAFHSLLFFDSRAWKRESGTYCIMFAL